jgi:hypothetical protein
MVNFQNQNLMKKFIKPMLILISSCFINTACQNSDKANLGNDPESTDSIINVNTNSSKLKSGNISQNFSSNEATSAKIEEFQLVSIDGQFAPHGAVYEFDEIKGLWCERPMAADIMAYMAQNNIEGEDLSNLPDLSNFFERQTTERLNSCRISIITTGNLINYLLTYNGKNICEGSFDKSDLINNNSKEINFKSLKNFELDAEGSMDLSGGNTYSIIIGKDPSISFSNEIGNYGLSFKAM